MYGLILAGGYSSRMGTDKAFISHKGELRYRHTARLLDACCTSVYLSCRHEQEVLFQDIQTIADDPILSDTGPLNGVVQAFRQHPGPWLVLGVDYPLLTSEDLEQLIQAREKQNPVTAFLTPGTALPEPLLAVYESDCGKLLETCLARGNASLRQFILQVGFNAVNARNPDHIQSFDTPESWDRIV
ncbi:MAG: NTP transferase domain-containing protein [Bacteroidetes bacterium]|nr:NTP transferase domain-containing protein [Bacteroidota bacterium]